MAMIAREVQSWLNSLEPFEEVGIDEGGLCLRVINTPEVYLEIGGIPLFSEEEEKEEGK